MWGAADILERVGQNIVEGGSKAAGYAKRGISKAGAALDEGMKSALDAVKPKPPKLEDVGTGGANQMAKDILKNAKEAEKIK